MKRTAAVILSLLALAALAAFRTEPPRPKVARPSTTFSVAPDSTVNARITTAIVSGALQPGDSIRYKVYKDGTPVWNRQSVDTVMLASGMPAPASGQTALYKPCVVPTRLGVNQGGELCGTAWSYTRPSAPVPTLAPPVITPASFTGQPGQSLTVTVTW